MPCPGRHSSSIVRRNLLRLEDRLTPSGTVSIVSQSDPSLLSDTAGGLSSIDQYRAQAGNGPLIVRSTSADGRYVVYTSTAPNIVLGQADPNNRRDVFLYDRVANSNVLVSHVSGNSLKAGSGESYSPAMSADGRDVVFLSLATDLVAGYDTGYPSSVPILAQVYRFEAATGITALVSHAATSPLVGAAGSNTSAVISDDGQWVTFQSGSSNMVTGAVYYTSGNPTQSHTFQANMATGQVTLVDHYSDHPLMSASYDCAFDGASSDGRFVVFTDRFAELDASIASPAYSLYLYDRLAGYSVMISRSVSKANSGGNGDSYYAAISQDGNYVAYPSASTDIVPGISDGNSADDVFLYSRLTKTTTLVSHAAADVSATAAGRSGIGVPQISADGRFIAYSSTAMDLVPGFVDGNGTTADIYVYDRLTNASTLVSRAAGSISQGGNGLNAQPIISGDGSTIVFASQATDLVVGFVDRDGFASDPNLSTGLDAYRWTPANGATLLSALTQSTAESGSGFSTTPTVSDDGRFATFTSAATNIVAGISDRNAWPDVVIKDTLTGAVLNASLSGAGKSTGSDGASGLFLRAPGHSDGRSPQREISNDGRFMVYTAFGDNLVAGESDANSDNDVMLFDRTSGTTTLVSHSWTSAAKSGNAGSRNPVISGDGRYIYYRSLATDIVSGFLDQNGTLNADYYCYDRVTGINQLVSHDWASPGAGSLGTQDAGEFTDDPRTYDLSDDGRFFAFTERYQLGGRLCEEQYRRCLLV